MRKGILVCGILSSAICGAASVGGGLVVIVTSGELTQALFLILLVPSILFSLIIVFKHVLDQIEVEMRLAPQPDTTPAHRSKPTEDTVGTPWATDPGGKDSPK